MRDMVTCFSEHAVKVSELTCSTYIPTHQNLPPAVQTAVIYLYKTTLISTQKQFLITVTWSRNQLGQGGLTITFGDSDDTSNSFKLNTFSRLFRKKKGHKSLEAPDTSRIDVFWDLSLATYNNLTGPEPVDGYYILVKVDIDLCLALGDLAHEAATKRLKSPAPWPKSTLVSRREHYSGNTLYCTQTQFCDTGETHDIVIKYVEEGDKTKQSVLYVSIDKRTVMKVKRLQWNFRGNQTVFVDGLLIDLMWDVHDWFFNPVSGCGVFMFKTRNCGESRLWLDEKSSQNDQDRVDFSLLLYASKNTT